MCFFLCKRKINNYLIDSDFGDIYIVRDKTSFKKKIVKKISKKKISIEIDKILLLDHPNIVKTYSYFIEYKTKYLVMEYCGDQDLFDYMISIIPCINIKCKNIIKQILEGVNYLHNFGITHRDIKPENIVVSYDKNKKLIIKIIDFDYSSSKKELSQKCGTIYYVAPEILNSSYGYYNYKCDIWSIGIIVYLFYFGKFPFSETTTRETINSILNMDLNLSIKIKDTISLNFISGLLDKNVKTRFDSKTALKHKWLN